MEAEILFLLGFIAFIWIPVTIVFLRRHHPPNVTTGNRIVQVSRRHRKYFKPAERKMHDQACRLLSEINEALRHNQRIHSDSKSSLKAQANQTTAYVMASLGKVARIRKHKAVLNSERQSEITKLENRLLTEVGRSLDVLEDALVSLTILDVARGDVTIDRLLDNLQESNARLKDIADAHEEVRNAGRVWIGEL